MTDFNYKLECNLFPLIQDIKNIVSNHSNHTSINDDIEVDSNVCLDLHKKKKFSNLKKSIEHKVCSILHDLYNVEGIEFYLYLYL